MVGSAQLPSLDSVLSGRNAPPPKPKHKSGGLWGDIRGAAHWTASKAELAGSDIKNMPGGLVQTAKVSLPIAQLITEGKLPSKRQTRDFVKFGKAQVTQAKETLQHPLRDPFATALTVAPFTHGLGKLGDLAAGGRLTEPRLLKVGEERVPLKTSRNPSVAAVQKAHDKVVQRALDTKPEGRLASYGTKRAGGSIAETARYQARMRQVPAGLLDQAARKLGRKMSGAQRVKQAALELTSTQTTPREAAAYHLGQAGKGINPELNRAVAKLYKRVDAEGMLTVRNGKVVVNEQTHPALAVADARLARVQRGGDEILAARYGVRSAEQLAARVNAPGRIRAGGRYEKPTPGKQGRSPATEAARTRVQRLQKSYDRLAAKGLRGGYKVATRPRTEAEATRRLATLEKRHQGFEQAVYERMFGDAKLTPDELAEQRYRNSVNGKIRRSRAGVTRTGKTSGAVGRYRGMRELPTVQAERWRQVQEEIDRTLKRLGDHPSAARMRQERDEIAALRSALETQPEELFGGTKASRDLGTVREARYTGATSPRLERAGGALSVARDELERLEQAAARRVKPTGIVGGENARPGRGFVSYKASEPKPSRNQLAGSPGPVVGEASSPISSKGFTGSGIEQGYVPKDVTGQASRHYHQLTRFVNTSELRKTAIKTGSNVRRTPRDVLVKLPGETHAALTPQVEELLGKSTLTADDVQGINAALEAFRSELVPGRASRFASEKGYGTGALAPAGHVWVDRNVLGDLAKPGPGPRTAIGRQLDNVNSAITAATVYFKVGHIGTRVLTNAATNIIQGSADPLSVARSVKLWRALTDEDKARALAAAGQHGFAALPHEGVGRIGGAVAKTAAAGAKWWAKHADAPFRFNSLAYEARRAGFKTPAQFRQLLNDLEDPSGLSPRQFAKVDGVAKAANREAIAYDRLNAAERRFITRAVWFYPWVKGSTMFLGNTLLEHPYKSALLGAAGKQGQRTQQNVLGALPSYEQGLIPLGGGSRPLVTDFSTFSPFATPADLADVASVGQAADFLNPGLSALVPLLLHQNAYGSHTNTPVTDALQALVASTPEAQIAFAPGAKPTQMFEKTRLAALERALVGPAMPRRINLPAAHSAAARERAGR